MPKDDDSADGGLSRHIDEVAFAAVRNGLSGRVLVGGTGQRYTVGPLRSEGGQGWVFLATVGPTVAPVAQRPGAPEQGATVIIKVLRADALSHEGRVRFHREAQVLRVLSEDPSPSPNVVRFHDYAEHELALVLDPAKTGRPAMSVLLPFTVLEFVPGSSLDQELARAPLPLTTVRTIVHDIAVGLEHVHARGVIHRDLKPANVLLSPHGAAWRAKLTDFGLVRIVSPDLARTARIAGASVGYAPPEQYERGNARVSARTDVFSFAAVIFEMLSGRPAYPYQPGDPPMPVLTKILSGARPSLQIAEGSPLLPLRAPIEAELHRALAPEPDQRHANARELAQAIDGLLARVTPSREIAAASVAPQAHLAPPRARSWPEWVFRSTGPRPPDAPWKAAVFASQGRTALVLSTRGFELVSAASVVPQETPSTIPFGRLHGFVRGPRGDLVLFGQGGVCGRLARDLGDYRPFVPTPRAEVLRGAVALVDGRAVLFGRARSGKGLLVFYRADGSVDAEHEIAGGELHAAILGAGAVLTFAGAAGTIVQIAPNSALAVSSVCAADLLAVAPLEGKLLFVGAGGHAICMDEDGHAQLEPVQTTRDLRVLRTELGAAWAAGDDGRVVVRAGRSWYRVDASAAPIATALALHVGEDAVELLWSDGAFCRGVKA